MDCCVCSPFARMYRPPRNSICLSCYDGAKGMLSFLEASSAGDKGDNGNRENDPKARDLQQQSSSVGMSDALKKMEEMKEREGEMRERLKFLESFVVAFRDGIQTDIQVIAGSGPPIPTHRALLATRSEIFRNLLTSDDRYKVAAGDAVTLPELSHGELRCLLEFLYTGSLLPDETSQCHSLIIAADKYDIPFLRHLCERQISSTLCPSNALRVLEVADQCNNAGLKSSAIDLIADYANDIVFSDEYEDFAHKNAHLGVEIMRAVLMKSGGRGR